MIEASSSTISVWYKDIPGSCELSVFGLGKNTKMGRPVLYQACEKALSALHTYTLYSTVYAELYCSMLGVEIKKNSNDESYNLIVHSSIIKSSNLFKTP